ncbi:restriction endonuclease subunit S [soil metagenome]
MTAIKRIKYAARPVEVRKEGRDLPLMSVSMRLGVIRRSEITDDLPRADDLTNYRVCWPNDLVINRMSAYQGALGRAREMGVVSPDYLVLRFEPTVDPRFGEYLFLSHYMVGEMTSLLRGVGSPGLGTVRTPRINWSDLGELPLDWPDLAVQRQIADYLDAQTAKIDTLIGKQERLIETLTERRQAVISHAVTKGLNPTAPTRDSSQPWVGQIPASWTLKRVSWLFRVVGSGTTPPSDDGKYYGDGIPWVTTGELREDIITETAKSVTPTALLAFSTLRVYEPGTLLMAMYGATIGRLAVLGTRACTNQACCAMAQPQGVLVKFAFYALLAAKEHVLVLAVGGGQPNINQEIVRSLRLPIPPIDEQESIASFLDSETSQIDLLSGKAREMIEVLKERRQALISAAVTGKIDVRGPF